MARFTSIVVTIVLAAIFVYPTTGRYWRTGENQQKVSLLIPFSIKHDWSFDMVKISGCPWILQNRLNFQRYLLVQISETMTGKGYRQLGDWVANKTNNWIAHKNTLENRVLNAAGSLGSAIKNTALNAFDKVAESSVPLPNIPAPNTGSLGK